jgi:hypothetical protein
MSAPQAHALLSASGSAKWLACTPSARFEQTFKDERSAFADEGVFAHAVFERDLNAYLGRPLTDLPSDLIQLDCALLRESVALAVGQGIEIIEEARALDPSAVVLLEHRVDFSRWVPQGFGTADLIVIAHDTITVADLKFGKGVVVQARENPQLRLYALGALAHFEALFALDRVRTVILQPRANNYASEDLLVSDLLSWAQAVVVPAAALAHEGLGNFVAGEHCSKGFCRGRFNCSARADSAMTAVRAVFKPVTPDRLSAEQIAQVLDRTTEIERFLSDVKTYASIQAKKGVSFAGWKLVATLGPRRFTNIEAVGAALTDVDLSESQIYQRSLISLTALESLLGKRQFVNLLGHLIERPEGSPLLVPATDPRPAYSPSLVSPHVSAAAEIPPQAGSLTYA